MFEYRGRTALVTGASSGIGTVFAEALAANGMHVILVARSAERLNQIATDIASRYGVRSEILIADLSDPNAAMAPAAACEQDHRVVKIDITKKRDV